MYETRISAWLNPKFQLLVCEVQIFKEDAEEPLVTELEQVSVVMQRGELLRAVSCIKTCSVHAPREMLGVSVLCEKFYRDLLKMGALCNLETRPIQNNAHLFLALDLMFCGPQAYTLAS